MPNIKYCEASIFLSEFLPIELSYQSQRISTGGRRTLLFWKPEYQTRPDGTGCFFSEFGRTYLGEHNTNEPHDLYIRKILERLYRSLMRLEKSPSFEVDDLMSKIPWKEKVKPSVSNMYL
ncbi:hypothetical protein JWG44_11875 [Leptospira sp. 201903071]|uniref:hypothetical protein n=1 Tax=Leptospira ainazelensis TaxID=2810034 RepID=UPI0019634817|nr:hypothetical protein [Leptospira ainazelensis]MBM9500949.1 hypothetical protein [Leptospira ainazelensis]